MGTRIDLQVRLSEGNPYKTAGWGSFLINNETMTPIGYVWHIADATRESAATRSSRS